MNLNFCRHCCGKSWHPHKIAIDGNGNWYLCMGDDFVTDECRYVRIEPIQEFLENPPKGWYRFSNDEILFEEGNAEDALWRVKLVGGDSTCPYVAEHMMYDIQHDKRMFEWRNREARRMDIIKERMKCHD